ncbi:hypothetical protein PI125_g9874 [Phytophthora idaei]|nr:hypothetical protein PI125_g9874 [Phytophthora idaei]
MLIKVLGVLPGHLWGSAIMFTPEEFTTERVETKLTAIFGGKSRAEINTLAKGMHVNHVDAAPAKPKGGALVKRKAFDGPDMHSNLGIMRCHNCAGVHNNMNCIGPHKNIACPKRAHDQSLKVFRRNIWLEPTRRVRSDHYEPTPKTMGKGKGKFRAERKEIPTEDCLPKDVPCKAVQAKQPASPVPSLTPPSGTFDAMDTDEPMELFDMAVNHGDVNAPGIVTDQAMQTTAQELDRIAMELEDMVRSMYPFLLECGNGLTSESWVLDSGCGFGLTSDASKLVEQRPNNGYMFTFAEGSKHTNTHVGTVKLYLRGPNGVKPFLLENIALVPHAKSNILSEYWLQRGGYKIVSSPTGEFKFVLYGNMLVFVAKAINEAYHVQNQTVRER